MMRRMRISMADVGWFLFALSGLFFLSDALDSGDRTAMASAVTWLAGIVFFLIGSRRSTDSSDL